MNLYKLDDKTMDENFLKGHPVFCRAVLSPKEVSAMKIKEGDPIVVMLSNGAKYKGKVIRFNPVIINEYALGELEIIKSS